MFSGTRVAPSLTALAREHEIWRNKAPLRGQGLVGEKKKYGITEIMADESRCLRVSISRDPFLSTAQVDVKDLFQPSNVATLLLSMHWHLARRIASRSNLKGAPTSR
jgi:hypothetical protein